MSREYDKVRTEREDLLARFVHPGLREKARQEIHILSPWQLLFFLHHIENFRYEGIGGATFMACISVLLTPTCGMLLASACKIPESLAIGCVIIITLLSPCGIVIADNIRRDRRVAAHYEVKDTILEAISRHPDPRIVFVVLKWLQDQPDYFRQYDNKSGQLDIITSIALCLERHIPRLSDEEKRELVLEQRVLLQKFMIGVQDHVSLKVAIIDILGRYDCHLNPEVIKALIPKPAISAEQQLISEAAVMCLARIQDQQWAVYNRQTLLRGTSVPRCASTELLQPATEAVHSASEKAGQLLRSTAEQYPTASTNLYISLPVENLAEQTSEHYNTP